MRATNAALAAYRAETGDPEPIVRYILPHKPVVIGYAIREGMRANKLHADGVSARQLEQPHVEVKFSLVRASGNNGSNGLYFLTIRQGPGSIRYRWTDPNGVEQIMFVCATQEVPDPTLHKALANAKDYFERRKKIWSIAYRGKISETAADRVFNAVNKKLALAYLACDVARGAARTNGVAEGMETIRRLQRDPAETVRFFTQLGISASRNAHPKILNGALAALA